MVLAGVRSCFTLTEEQAVMNINGKLKPNVLTIKPTIEPP